MHRSAAKFAAFQVAKGSYCSAKNRVAYPIVSFGDAAVAPRRALKSEGGRVSSLRIRQLSDCGDAVLCHCHAQLIGEKIGDIVVG